MIKYFQCLGVPWFNVNVAPPVVLLLYNSNSDFGCYSLVKVLTAIKCSATLSEKTGSWTEREFWTGNEVPAGHENLRPGLIQGVVALRQMRCCLPATTVKVCTCTI